MQNPLCRHLRENKVVLVISARGYTAVVACYACMSPAVWPAVGPGVLKVLLHLMGSSTEDPTIASNGSIADMKPQYCEHSRHRLKHRVGQLLGVCREATAGDLKSFLHVQRSPRCMQVRGRSHLISSLQHAVQHELLVLLLQRWCIPRVTVLCLQSALHRVTYPGACNRVVADGR